MVDSDRYIEHDLLVSLNGKIGIFAIAVAIIFIHIIILIFIVRIFQFPRFRQQVINYYIADSTRSVPTRILKMIIFLLLTAGLVAVTYYNVDKMINSPPKLSTELTENKSFPSMLFCRNLPNVQCAGAELEIIVANYFESLSNFTKEIEKADKNEESEIKPLVDLTTSHVLNSNYSRGCIFLNGTLLLEQNVTARGTYDLIFNASNVYLFMGDTDNDMNWKLPIPHGSKFSGIDYIGLEAGNVSIFKYTETRTQALNGTTYRSFQMSYKGYTRYNAVENFVEVIIDAPTYVMTNVLKPPLTLVELFSSIGGYLSIWGIFAFLFGRGKMDPFGFVSRFIFVEQDRAKLLKELKKMRDDRSVELSNTEKEVDIVTEKNNLSNQDELKNLLAKYYVYMDFYENDIQDIC
jgi:hypothetical protein